MAARALLGTDPARERPRLVAGVLLGAAGSALVGAALPVPGLPRFVGPAAQILLVAVSVALLALGFGGGDVFLTDFALLFPAYYVRAQEVGIGFRTPVEHALPQAAMDAALLGLVAVGLWLAARRVVGPGDDRHLAGRYGSE